jgi:hypothetical protein
LSGADLAVGALQGGDSRSGEGERSRPPVKVDPALNVDGDLSELLRIGGRCGGVSPGQQDRRVFDGGGDQTRAGAAGGIRQALQARAQGGRAAGGEAERLGGDA